MATQRTSTRGNDPFGETAERITGFTDQAAATGKRAGAAYLDACEKVVLSTLDAYERSAAATNVEWVSTVAAAQTGLTRELTKACVATARELSASSAAGSAGGR